MYNRVVCILALGVLSAQSAPINTFTSVGGLIYKNGERLIIKGVNWLGFDDHGAVFHGLWVHDYNFYLDFLAKNKFNAIRVLLALDTVMNDPKIYGLNFGTCPDDSSCNLDLEGLTSLQALDVMVAAAARRGIYILLDMHGFKANDRASGRWYDSTHPESAIFAGWRKLTARYADASNILGADLKNEPFDSTWGTGDTDTDWAMAATSIGNAILESGVGWLIFVAGTWNSPSCNNCFWGENLIGAGTFPVALSVPYRLIYTPHVYGPSITVMPYMVAADFPANLFAIYEAHWAYLKTARVDAAIVIGEWGGYVTPGLNLAWLKAWLAYLQNRTILDTFVFCLDPISSDTDGLLLDDWTTPNSVLLDLIANLYNSAPTPRPIATPSTIPVTSNGRCGPAVGATCPLPLCCSIYGHCGATPQHCAPLVCLDLFGTCAWASSTVTASSSGLATDLLTQTASVSRSLSLTPSGSQRASATRSTSLTGSQFSTLSSSGTASTSRTASAAMTASAGVLSSMTASRAISPTGSATVSSRASFFPSATRSASASLTISPRSATVSSTASSTATMTLSSSYTASINWRCGSANLMPCPLGSCCSNFGWCGTTPEYCAVGLCNATFGACYTSYSSTLTWSQRTTGSPSPMPSLTVSSTQVVSSLATTTSSAASSVSFSASSTLSVVLVIPMGSSTASAMNSVTALVSPTAFPISTNWRCGSANLMSCQQGMCCSNFGWCGTTPEFCAEGLCNSTFGVCNTTYSATSSPSVARTQGNTSLTFNGYAVSTDARCGPVAMTACPLGSCCSLFGWCGATEQHCAISSCNPTFGNCSSVPGPNVSAAATPPPDTLSAYLCGVVGNGVNKCGVLAPCCSIYGFCGNTSAYCGVGQCQPSFSSACGGDTLAYAQVGTAGAAYATATGFLLLSSSSPESLSTTVVTSAPFRQSIAGAITNASGVRLDQDAVRVQVATSIRADAVGAARTVWVEVSVESFIDVAPVVAALEGPPAPTIRAAGFVYNVTARPVQANASSDAPLAEPFSGSSDSQSLSIAVKILIIAACGFAVLITLAAVLAIEWWRRRPRLTPALKDAPVLTQVTVASPAVASPATPTCERARNVSSAGASTPPQKVTGSLAGIGTTESRQSLSGEALLYFMADSPPRLPRASIARSTPNRASPPIARSTADSPPQLPRASVARSTPNRASPPPRASIARSTAGSASPLSRASIAKSTPLTPSE